MAENMIEGGQNNTDVTDPIDANKPADPPADPPADDPNAPPADGGNEGEGGEGENKDGEGKDDPQVPETYEFNLPEGLPEGIELDQGLIDSMSPILKKHNLTQEAVNELTEAFAMNEAKKVQGWGETLSQRDEKWTAEIQNDPEVGGDKLGQSQAMAKSAVLAMGGQELLDEIVDAGLGNNPRLFKMMVKVGRLTGEDGGDRGDNVNTDKRTEDKWYT